MKRLSMLLAAVVTVVVIQSHDLFGQSVETVGSLAAKGFEVKGFGASGAGGAIIMQKGREVYFCIVWMSGESASPCSLIK